MESFEPLKRIDEKHIVVDINDFKDMNQIISLNEKLNQNIFILNNLVTARLHYYNIILIKKDFFESIELYLFLFNKHLNESEEKIYNSMRTFPKNFTLN